jgi:hypothetical protein
MIQQQIEIWEIPCMSRVLVGGEDGLEKEIEEGSLPLRARVLSFRLSERFEKKEEPQPTSTFDRGWISNKQ